MDQQFMEYYDCDIPDEDLSEYLDLCPVCDRVLPAPEIEARDGGNSELVIYCKCGTSFVL